MAPQTPPSFPILATPIAAMTPAPMTPDIPQATMIPAPITPDIHQKEESRPPIQWNYPIYEGKGEDMLLQMSKGIGKGRLPAYEREYPLPKPPPPPEEYTGVPTTPPMPRPAGVESPPPPPSPDAMSEVSDSAVLERVFKWLKGRRLCLQPGWRLLH